MVEERQKSLDTLYNGLISGTYNTLGNQVSIVNQIVKLIPELSPQGANGISDFTQKELEQIIMKFIQKNNKKLNNNLTIRGSKNIYNQEIWKGKILPYYEANKNNLKDIAQILGGDQQQTTTKLYNAFNRLGLLTDVIYDKDRREFQFIHIGDQSGLRPIKLSQGLFKLIIKIKSQGFTASEKQQAQTYYKTVYEAIKSQNGLSKLHVNVTETDDYKFVRAVLKKLQIMKQYKKLDKKILQQNKSNKNCGLSVNGAVNKIFNKLKEFKGDLSQNKNDNTKEFLLNKRKIEKALYTTDNAYNPFQSIVNNTNSSLQVIGDSADVSKVQTLKKSKFNDKLISKLKYIPSKSTIKAETTKFEESQSIIDNLRKILEKKP